MKTAVWYTSTFVVIFVYLYVYLVQFIRGAEIRPPLRLHQPLRSRLGAPPPPLPPPPPLSVTQPVWPAGPLPPPSQRHVPPPPPPPAVFSDYMIPTGPGHLAVASSIAVSSAPVQPPAPKPLDFTYHNYEDMTNWLKHFSASNPDLTALYSIGKSVQGWMNHLFVFSFSSSASSYSLAAAGALQPNWLAQPSNASRSFPQYDGSVRLVSNNKETAQLPRDVQRRINDE